MTFDGLGIAGVQTMDDRIERHRLVVDVASATITLTRPDGSLAARFGHEVRPDGVLRLRRRDGSGPDELELQPVDLPATLRRLRSR